ncbi:ATP-binding protein [Streptosporangium sp. NPDC000563]|uniref:ATP-binding protein n=1 Tax=Streptosporangium sp. NPDC000563 TaxID=3154366 RepID=UPI00331BB839
MTAADPSSQHSPLTTREGWMKFVLTTSSDFTIVPIEHKAAFNGLQRDEYERDKLEYHARLVVATPALWQTVHAGQRLTLLNCGQISARRELVVIGGAGTGKTTAIAQLGKHHDLQLRRRLGVGKNLLPVVYVALPPGATAKMITAEFARFLGIPLTKSFNHINITNAVCDVLCDLGTSLVLIDEIHNIALTTRNSKEASKHVKHLAERIPATFVYSGIDTVGLSNEGSGNQIASRFTAITTSNFAYGNNEQREAWNALIATFEDALRLDHHQPGSLVRLAGYLHNRTGGMIGSLSHLIRAAAIESILTGTEKITKKVFDQIQLDHAAETNRKQNHPRPQRSTRDHRDDSGEAT